jgi:predicted GTPase
MPYQGPDLVEGNFAPAAPVGFGPGAAVGSCGGGLSGPGAAVGPSARVQGGDGAFVTPVRSPEAPTPHECHSRCSCPSGRVHTANALTLDRDGSPTRVVIMGAAGRDFHNFNVFFRGNPRYEVVAFTATQIPDIAGRRYPPELAGPGYPQGIPISPEENLAGIISEKRPHRAVFAYSDVSHTYVMRQASRCLALGLDFWLMGPESTMLSSPKPVVAVTAVRTGAGKSQTTRRLVDLLRRRGLRVVVVRHPMPYGDLVRQAVQRFATYEDLGRQAVTIEEREEYEPHLRQGVIVYAGVDYAAILAEASQEADIILWDGGNNDLPFYRPHLHIVVVDPHRPGHETAYHPGEVNLRMAHVVVINKIDTARPAAVEAVREAARRVNPAAMIIEAASPISVDDHQSLRGKRVLVIEDGPTLTHGEMKYGAGVIAARKFGAAELVDPRPYAVGSIREAFGRYQVGRLLPAMGYGGPQIADLEATVARTPADLVVIATPIDLRRLINIRQPAVRVSYELVEIGRPDLSDALDRYLGPQALAGPQDLRPLASIGWMRPGVPPLPGQSPTSDAPQAPVDL